MTFKKKTHASYSQRNDFWQSVDMNEYYMSDRYREEVDRAWDQHRYLWDKKYERIDVERTRSKD